jgi:hypothetical protein
VKDFSTENPEKPTKKKKSQNVNQPDWNAVQPSEYNDKDRPNRRIGNHRKQGKACCRETGEDKWSGFFSG